MSVARLSFSLVNVRQNLLATLQIALAGFRERETPRGAIEQSRTQMRLKIRDRARDVRGIIRIVYGAKADRRTWRSYDITSNRRLCEYRRDRPENLWNR